MFTFINLQLSTRGYADESKGVVEKQELVAFISAWV